MKKLEGMNSNGQTSIHKTLASYATYYYTYVADVYVYDEYRAHTHASVPRVEQACDTT